MSLTKIEPLFTDKLTELQLQGISKGCEKVVTGMKAAGDGFGARYFLEGQGDKLFFGHEFKFLPRTFSKPEPD